MNIYETKSKYFHNSNSWFAGKFSGIAITLVIIFIGLVVAYKSIQGFLYGKLETKLNKAVTEYFTGDFQCKGLKLLYNMNDGEGDYVEFLYTCKWLSHPKLNGGEPINNPDIIVSVNHRSDNEIVIAHVGFKWEDSHYKRYTIDNWYTYLSDPVGGLVMK
jgi:hypothetical protein